MTKLHLGCGRKILPGYINIDATCGDKVMDIRKLTDYADNSVDEILAIHVWEHFWLKDVETIAAEWKRVLKPGGKLILEMPCLDKVIGYIVKQATHGFPIEANMTIWAMYGDPSTIRTEQDLHKWLWSYANIEALLRDTEFKNVEFKDPVYHVKDRDMRVEAIK